MSASTSSPPLADRRLPTVTAKVIDHAGPLVVLGIPNTDYKLHLVPPGGGQPAIGVKVTAAIHARAKRVDVVPAGGRYIEPVFGRPRRAQGRVSGGDVSQNLLYVRAGAPLVVQLMESQKATDFKVGQLVSFDVERGARFEAGE